MPIVNGITCTVRIGGLDTPEYGTDVHGATGNCSIVSQEGKAFTFLLNFIGSPAGRHDYKIFADGIELAYYTSPSRLQEVVKSRKVTNGVTEHREFKFARLETVDHKSENLESRGDIIKEVGTLKVQVWRAQVQSVPQIPRDTIKVDAIAQVHEKALKGRSVSHKTALGAASYVPAQSTTTYPIDPVDMPYATFVFRYTSKSHLQYEGLISRSPSPEPAPARRGGGEDDVQQMSAEDLRREVLRLRNQNRNYNNSTIKQEHRERTLVKRERSDVSTGESGDQVVFQSARSVKRRKSEPIEVIDLIDD